MRKNSSWSVIILFCFLILSACAMTSNDSTQKKTAGNVQTLIFPADKKERSQYNARILDVKPFQISFILPKGWKTEREWESKEYLYFSSSFFSAYSIYNEKGEIVGMAGYNIYELYEGAEDKPNAIYSMIDLGSGYRFDVSASYERIRHHEYGDTAIVPVYYSASAISNGPKENIGVLSYNKDQLVYVGIELDKTKVQVEEAIALAKSLNFK